eukprot:m.223822 g.223822  ORF g.223822 m.223822 type:complete len:75 (-) comp17027_c2_seq4:836-1060(-)
MNNMHRPAFSLNPFSLNSLLVSILIDDLHSIPELCLVLSINDAIWTEHLEVCTAIWLVLVDEWVCLCPQVMGER